MKNGRLHLRGLALQSGLSLRYLKHGIVVLIQEQLALHHTGEDGITYYEANWVQAYALARCGVMVNLMEQRLGDSAAGIISNLLLLGNARVGDLTDAYGFKRNSSRIAIPAAQAVNEIGPPDSEFTSQSRSEIRSLNDLHTTLNRLLLLKYIVPVHETDFAPHADVHNDAERSVKQSRFPEGVKGKTQRQEYDNAVRDLKRKWRDDREVPTQGDEHAVSSTRSNNTAVQRQHKRTKLGARLTNGINGAHGRFGEEDDIHLQVW